MPHLIVEYSSNLAGFPEAQTLTKLNQAVTSSPEVLNEADLKTRIVATDSYVIGTAPGPRLRLVPTAPVVRPQPGCQTRPVRPHRRRALPTDTPPHRSAGGHGPGVLHEGSAWRGLKGLLVRNLPFAAGISADPMFEVNIQPAHLSRLSFRGQDIGM